ncbi:MAG: type I methionyl aminopeptidase [Erysipelotrichaceae bacterium]|jgi:methionyl aminopeptidase|nr:type I methionyl aminopeptidase [Erysipelotrichaceae bacterium]
MITLKSPREIALMKEAGAVVAKVFEGLKAALRPGLSTLELDELANEIITSNGGISAEKGYYGYPGNICISVNDTVLHGIPSSKIILKEGDIVSFDIVVRKHGYCADACRTYPVGMTSPKALRLIEVTRQSFFEAVKLIKPGVHLGDIQAKIQEVNESNGYSLIRDYTGHGIGREMHEDPSIPNYGKAGTGIILKEGMTICIEPMVAEGKSATRVLGDGWTVKMKDEKLSCHYENTVAVTADGYEILTLDEGEK